MAAFIIYIIRWAVALTMIYSLFGLFLKRETLHGFNRVVLLAILVISMALPLCQINIKEPNYVVQGREKVETEIVRLQQILEITNEPWLHRKEYIEKIKKEEANKPEIFTQRRHDASKKLKDNGWTWSWGHTLLLAIEIYLVGLLFCWLRYFWQLAALLLLIRRGKRIEVEGLPKHVRVIVHPDVKTPCSWMRWIILPTSDAEVITPLPHREGQGVGLQGVGLILRHELAHIRYGHSWDMLLCEFTCRMLWCVPFAWMLRQDLRDVHEYQADRRVLATGIQDEEYQLLLIRKATGTGLQPVVNALNQSPIKRRFKMMYKKPSRRWVALKAAYLLPLSLMALMAFARPQAMSEIEQKIETTETEVTQAIAESDVIDKVASIAENLGLKEREPEQEPQAAEIASALEGNVLIAEPTDTLTAMADANLVKADLAELQPATDPFAALPLDRANELLDSTMQAVGARKIADGTWIGHFQPSLNDDTVRISQVEYLDKQSRQTGRLRFAHNESDPYAYKMLLQDETRKDRTGYYIRKLYPAKATERSYDKPKNDPNMLSTDEVLTNRENNFLYRAFEPVAIERSKKETRVYFYFGYGGHPQWTKQRKQDYNPFLGLAIIDEHTGDRYLCRSMDYSYLKYVKDEYINKDTISFYQVCLVFPPLAKNIGDAYFGNAATGDNRWGKTFNLNTIPAKARIITN